jgi:hypothetical protein
VWTLWTLNCKVSALFCHQQQGRNVGMKRVDTMDTELQGIGIPLKEQSETEKTDAATALFASVRL